MKRRPHAALIRRALAALHAAVPAPSIGPIVTEVDDNGLFGDVQVIEFGKQSAHIPVDVLTHGQRRPNVGHVLTLGIAVVHLQLFVLESVPPAVGHLHGRMGRVVGEVGEEGLAGSVTLLDECDGPVGKVIDHESLAPDDLSVVIEGRAEVVTPVPGTESVVLVEAASIGMIRILHAIVPLPEGPGGIPRRLEGVGNRRFVQVHPFAPGRRAVHAAPRMVATRQELGTGG